MLHGFDISSYQGTPDIAALADRYGLQFLACKATEGQTWSDKTFATNWANAKSAGLVRIAYHFARPESSSGTAQADRIIAAAKAEPGDLLCCDLETSDLNQAQTNAWAKAFGDRLREKAPGVATVLYTGGGYATNNTGRDLNQHFDLWWFPQYPSTEPTTKWPAFTPKVPDDLTIGWSEPHIWQFSANFADKYDANVSPLTLDELSSGQPPTP